MSDYKGFSICQATVDREQSKVMEQRDVCTIVRGCGETEQVADWRDYNRSSKQRRSPLQTLMQDARGSLIR